MLAMVSVPDMLVELLTVDPFVDSAGITCVGNNRGPPSVSVAIQEGRVVGRSRGGSCRGSSPKPADAFAGDRSEGE